MLEHGTANGFWRAVGVDAIVVMFECFYLSIFDLDAGREEELLAVSKTN